ncbi:host cell division inhibitor Icd-like protein [Providencia sp. PROV266]|uniref:host cell division inhibitor Icd-like protein n=1 Tax=Providencia sp. PROV266 TaxID=2949954 RepID=UPI00234B015E
MITLCSIKGIAYQERDSLLAGGESVKVDALLSILNLTSSYSQSDKLSSGYLANILAQYSVNILTLQSAKTLADVLAKIYANQSAKHFANLKGGEITSFAKGDFSHLSKVGKSRYLSNEIEFSDITINNYRQNSDGYHLRSLLILGYSKNALAKSSVRICTLNPYKATHDAPSVFFCVYAYAYLRFAVLYRPNSMVMLAGQPKGWLVSLYASSANPVSVTTPIEICTSGGDSLVLYKEIIVMMATPTQTQFKFLFLSVKRSDTTAKPCRIAVTASNEHDARLMLVRDYILSFAGRLPAQEVAA